MRITSIDNNQRQQHFGVLKRPFTKKVSEYIYRYTDKECNKYLDLVIEEIAKTQKKNKMFDLQPILKYSEGLPNTPEGFAVQVVERKNGKVVSLHSHTVENQEDFETYPHFISTLKAASEDASLKRALNKKHWWQ